MSSVVLLFLDAIWILSGCLWIMEQVVQMSVDEEAWFERCLRGIGLDLRTINVQFLTPDQSRLLALLHNGLKETPKGFHPITVAYPGQARMIGERLIQIISHIPADTQPISNLAHQQTF